MFREIISPILRMMLPTGSIVGALYHKL